MDGLVEKINNKVSKQAISKYKNGLMMPDSSVELESLYRDVPTFENPFRGLVATGRDDVGRANGNPFIVLNAHMPTDRKRASRRSTSWRTSATPSIPVCARPRRKNYATRSEACFCCPVRCSNANSEPSVLKFRSSNLRP